MNDSATQKALAPAAPKRRFLGYLPRFILSVLFGCLFTLVLLTIAVNQLGQAQFEAVVRWQSEHVPLAFALLFLVAGIVMLALWFLFGLLVSLGHYLRAASARRTKASADALDEAIMLDENGQPWILVPRSNLEITWLGWLVIAAIVIGVGAWQIRATVDATPKTLPPVLTRSESPR
jgi:hypothetical protein